MRDLEDTFGKPTWVNPEGSKWWRQEKYEDAELPGVTVWVVQAKAGNAEYLIMKGQDVAWMGSQLEAVGIQLDVMKYLANASK